MTSNMVAGRSVLVGHTFFLNRGIGRKELVLLAPHPVSTAPDGARYCVAQIGAGCWGNWDYFDTEDAARAAYDAARGTLARHYPDNSPLI